MTRIVLVQGDQLSSGLDSLNAADRDRDVILICEAWDETQYVRHHKKKIAFVFAAMRHFAEDLASTGGRVDYRAFDPAAKAKSCAYQNPIHREKRLNDVLFNTSPPMCAIGDIEPP